jgi:hypothetical protein
MRQTRYLDLITAVFITTLLTSNLVASKTALLFGHVVGVGVFVFPISYIFGDVLTEVYGYRASRKVIWLGFASVGLAAAIFHFCVAATPAPGFRNQAAFETILGQSPHVLAASMIAYFVGEFCNSFVLARLKVATEGRMLWLRTISSTIVGEGIDSLIFYPLAFFVLPTLVGFAAGVWDLASVREVMINNYLLKLGIEVAATPATYLFVNFLKRAEGIDVFDRGTRFNPFALTDNGPSQSGPDVDV